MSNIIQEIENKQIRTDLPEFRVGDTVRVNIRVVEGNRERIQAFDGIVIKRKGSGAREAFTVRKISFGVGVERTFPVNSPKIDSIKILRRGKVRRSKLYYLRKLKGKRATRIKELRK